MHNTFPRLYTRSMFNRSSLRYHWLDWGSFLMIHGGAVAWWTEFGLTNVSLGLEGPWRGLKKGINYLSLFFYIVYFFLFYLFIYFFFTFNSMGKSVPPCDDRERSFSLPEQHRDISEDLDRSFHFIFDIKQYIIRSHMVFILLVWKFVYGVFYLAYLPYGLYPITNVTVLFPGFSQRSRFA